MKMRTFFIAVLALVLVCSTVRAADYYIAPTGLGGDDTGAGTIAAPWATPSRGAGVRVVGNLLSGASVVDVTETQGFLSSGTIDIAGTDYAYSSKTATSFQLTGTLAGAVAEHTIVNDNDILGGVGFQPGDNIIFRGPVGQPANNSEKYYQQRLRLKASGTDGNPITYKAYAGERPYIEIFELAGAPGMLYNDGDDPGTGTEWVVIDGLILQSTQEGAAFPGPTVSVTRFNNTIFRNTEILQADTTGGQLAYGVRAVYCDNLLIEDSIIYTHKEAAFRPVISGSYTIRNTVIGGKKGIVNIYPGVTLEMDHLTFVDLEQAAAVYMEDDTGNYNSFIKNSIIIGGLSEGLSDGQGDYNNVSNNATNYGVAWDGPGGLGGGSDHDISEDPNFLVSGFWSWSDANKYDPNWLRYDVSEASATAGEGGTYLGAFAPVPEPATLALLLVSGLGVALLRRK